MTKRRPPDSRQEALTHILERLGEHDAAHAANQSVGHLRNCSTPGSGRELALHAALALDERMDEKHGETPLLAWYLARLAKRRAGDPGTGVGIVERLERIRVELRRAAAALEAALRDDAIPAGALGELAQLRLEAAQLGKLLADGIELRHERLEREREELRKEAHQRVDEQYRRVPRLVPGDDERSA
jgi:hypothetical protein